MTGGLHRRCPLLVFLRIMCRVLRLESGDRIVVVVRQHLHQEAEVLGDRRVLDAVGLPESDEGIDVLRRDLAWVVGRDQTVLLQLVEYLPDLHEAPPGSPVGVGGDVPELGGHVLVEAVGEGIATHL